MAGGRFELRPVGPFSFGASVRILEGFAPAAYEGNEAGHLHLAFLADGGEDVAGVCVREEGGVILGEVSGDAEVGVVKRQVELILSLDVDGSAFPEVGERDPAVAKSYRSVTRACGRFASIRRTRPLRGRSSASASGSCRRRRSRTAWPPNSVPPSKSTVLESTPSRDQRS